MTEVATPSMVGALDLAADRARYAIRNVRALIGGEIVDEAVIGVNDGRIESIRFGRGPTDAIDGHHLLLIPGLVDTHSDGLEKEANPRRTSHFPLDYAIRAFEGRLRSSGVTTVFHGVGYQQKERAGRSIEGARELNRVITERGNDPGAMVDHRVLFRLEARDDRALSPLLEDLEAGQLGTVPMISFEDHTPGQGQYRDAEMFRAAIHPEDLPEGQTVDDYVDAIMAEAATKLTVREDNIRRIAPLAEQGAIRLLAHDAEDGADVATSAEVGASIAEFPVSLEAARAARDVGMDIVMGAPNALRGSSHSGNASARDLVEAGLCDVLASDYLPPAMLNGAFALATDGRCLLPAALALITSGPARVAGLDDRGKIEVGARADLVLVDDRSRWPSIVGVRRGDDPLTQHVFG